MQLEILFQLYLLSLAFYDKLWPVPFLLFLPLRKNHSIVPFKWVESMVQELYLNKAVFQNHKGQRQSDLKTWQ